MMESRERKTIFILSAGTSPAGLEKVTHRSAKSRVPLVQTLMMFCLSPE